jgi:hypothetical protein
MTHGGTRGGARKAFRTILSSPYSLVLGVWSGACAAPPANVEDSSGSVGGSRAPSEGSVAPGAAESGGRPTTALPPLGGTLAAGSPGTGEVTLVTGGGESGPTVRPGGNGGTGPSGVSIGGQTGLLTEEQWAVATGPLPGEHFLETRTCPGERIAQAYRIVPTVVCRMSPSWTLANPVRDCTLEPLCTGPEQCQEGAFGVCRGTTYATCKYPVGVNEPCVSDSDCTSLPDGRCPMQVMSDILCYPTGECRQPTQHCYYRDQPCESDSDCDSVTGGTCAKLILYARCDYHQCRQDSDCAVGSRCACSEFTLSNRCVPADCSTDEECGVGQVCRLEVGCHGMLIGYHCSTSADTCQSDPDCTPATCGYSQDRWQCFLRDCPMID